MTTVDHTVPQIWMVNSELVDAYAHCREDIVNVLPVPSNENSKKGSSPIRFLSTDALSPDAPDHALFDPAPYEAWSEPRQAISARRIAYSFLSIGLMTEQHDAQSPLREQGPGCAYYANDRVRNHIVRLLRDPRCDPKVHERLVNYVMLFLARRWNPLVEMNLLHDQSEFAAEYTELLKQRLAGETELPKLLGGALKAAVAGFPA